MKSELYRQLYAECLAPDRRRTKHCRKVARAGAKGGGRRSGGKVVRLAGLPAGSLAAPLTPRSGRSGRFYRSTAWKSDVLVRDRGPKRFVISDAEDTASFPQDGPVMVGVYPSSDEDLSRQLDWHEFESLDDAMDEIESGKLDGLRRRRK